MKFLIEMTEKKDYENKNGLTDSELKKLFARKIKMLFNEEDRNKLKIKVRLIKYGK